MRLLNREQVFNVQYTRIAEDEFVIYRVWSAVAKPAEVERYLEHLQKETFPAIKKLEGFVEAFVLRNDAADGPHIQVVTVWRSIEAIRAFAGADETKAVVPKEAQEMMQRFDENAVHYERVSSFR